METTSQDKQAPSRGLKQVKVDNWGTFFLQRLQQLYFEEELLDLTFKFPTSDITVQVQIINHIKNVLIILLHSFQYIFMTIIFNTLGPSFSYNDMHRLLHATRTGAKGEG